MGRLYATETKTKKYRVILADPPWQFDDKLPGETRGAAKNYSTLTHGAVMGFLEHHRVQTHDDAWLFLWCVESMQQKAIDVAEYWGFEPFASIVWVKTTKNGKLHFGMGRAGPRASHERMIIARKGKPKRYSGSVRSVFMAERPPKHSAKPDQQYEIIEQLAGKRCRKLELFARQRREGWDQIGRQLPRG